MKKNKKIPNTPKYGFGGMNSDAKKNVKDFAGNYGKFLLDNSANLIGIDAVGAGKGMDYSGKSADEFNKVSNVTGAVSKSLAPIAANIIAPGSGQFVSMGQQVAGGAYGKFGPQNEQGYNAYDNEGNPIVNQNDRSAQFGQMAGQIGGMAGGMMSGGSGGMGAGFMSNLPSGTPPLAMKYGGQMKYAMGGMNKYPGGGTGEGNGQIELDENSTINGKFTQYDELDHNQQDPNQPNASLAPGEKIFSAKLKIGNKTIADLNKANNTNREDKLLKDSTLGKTSALSLHLTKMAKMKNSDVLFAMQEQLKKDKVAAYAKKMGVEIPPMDNQQMNPQGMPGQPQNAVATGKYGGMFAMGGVQLPYYNTDNAGNPIYAMGGGYPAMTNPYHNFRGNIPMYEDGGNMPLDPPTTNGTTPILKASDVPSYGKTGYDEASMKNKDTKFEVYNNPDYLIQNPNIDTGKWNDFQKFLGTYKLPNGENFVGNKAGNTKLANDYTNLAISDYNKGLSDKQKSVSLGDIEEVQKYYNQGDPNVPVDRILGSKTTQFRYPFFSSASKVKAKENTFMPITYGGQQYVVDAETYNSKILPVSEGTSNENVTQYFQKYDPKKHRMIDQKHVDLVNKVGGLEGGSGRFRVENVPYPKFTYNAGAKEDYQTQWKNYQIENGLIKDDANVVKIKENFKYGGQMQMPKFWGGGPYIDPSETGMQEQADMNAYYDNLNRKTNNNNFVNSNGFVGNIPSNFNFERSRAFNKEQNQRNLAFNQMTGNKNPGYSNPNVPTVEDTGEGVVVPGVPVPQYETDYTNALGPDWYSKEETRKRENESMARIPDSSFTQMNPNSKNFNWGKLTSNVANFAGQNMGNIYDLTRKNEPLETYDLMTAKYLDPTQAIAGENYIGRQTKSAIPGLVGGNAGAAMNLLGANKANTATRIGRLRETYDNANAQIGNQVNQYNTGIKKDQAVARAANAAALENVRSQAVHSIGSNFGKMTKSGKQDNMDQDTLKMFQWRYQNEPGFKKYIDNFSSEEGTA